MTKVWTDITGQSETYPLVEYTYDCFGNVETVKTRSDSSTERTTTYTYDLSNRVVRIDYPTVDQGQDVLAPEEFGYDAVGNLLAKRIVSTGANKATLYEYDALNRLTDVYYVANYTGSLSSPSYPGTADVTYTYEGGSHLRDTMTDSTGTSSYDYDIQDRLTIYMPGTPSNREIRYDYNNLGQKINMTLKQSGNTKLDADYFYYANGWLKEVDKGNSWLAKYAYDEVGNRTKVSLANDTYTAYDYSTNDPRYFITEIGHWKVGSPDTELGTIEYQERDGSGNPGQIQDWDGTRSYTYDVNNRLLTGGGTSYGYDWVGNRLNPPANPVPMVYDATDKLLLWPGQQSFTYHPTGSLKESRNVAGTTINKTWEYTGAELVSSVTHRNVAYASEMEWDSDTNRVSFTSSENTGTWEFVYDTTAGIPAVIEENDGDPIYYVREPDGELIARIDGENVSYYHFDELGSTRLLTGTSGSVTDAYTYDAWRKQTAHTGSTAQPYRYVGRLGYYSHYQDTNLFSQSSYQFLQLGVRFYDALTGRFTQRDRIAEKGGNSYVYVLDLPVRYFDPSGLIWCERTNHIPWFRCHFGSRPKPPSPLDCLMKAFKGAVKKIIVGKGDFNYAIGEPGTLDPLNSRDLCGLWSIADMFKGLPKKYQKALETCQEAVLEMAASVSHEERYGACTDCCEAIFAAIGKKDGTYYSCISSCKMFLPK